MSRTCAVAVWALAGAALALTGCMPHMTVDELKAQMPKRPPELNVLDAFVGKWQYEGQTKFAMLNETLKMSGTSQAEWEGNHWYLVSRGTEKMEHFDETKMLETWTYDAHAKKYRATWTSSLGLAIAECTYNDKDKTWHMTATDHTPWGQSCLKGTVQVRDADTIEWSVDEFMGLTKIMEMRFTAKRVK